MGKSKRRPQKNVVLWESNFVHYILCLSNIPLVGHFGGVVNAGLPSPVLRNRRLESCRCRFFFQILPSDPFIH